MEVLEAIKTRRSVRKYEDKNIELSLLTELLEAACWAPSSLNLQPWYFVAVKDKGEQAKILEIMSEVANYKKTELEKVFASSPEVIAETVAFFRSLGKANVIIMAFAQKEYEEDKKSAIIQSVAAACQNLALAAHAKGLGTCWMAAPTRYEFVQNFAKTYAPEKGELIAMMALGYKASEPKAPKRKDARFKII